MRVSKICQAPSCGVSLFAGRVGNAVHGAFEQAVGPFSHAITEVDYSAAGLRLNVLPVFFFIVGADWQNL